MRRFLLPAAAFALMTGCAGGPQPHVQNGVLAPLEINPALLQAQQAVVPPPLVVAAAPPPTMESAPPGAILIPEPPLPLPPIVETPLPKVAATPAPAPVVVKPVPPAPIAAPAPAPAPRIEAPPPQPAAVKTEPTVDITTLRTQLRKTPAIGVFAKLSLEKEVDELQDRFSVLYRAGKRAGTATLRLPFDTLVHKVIAMLRDGDPSLAATITRSREAIWQYLVDPEKFSPAS